MSGGPLQAKWDAIHEHATQISQDSGFMALGFEGWSEWWANESFILRESRIESATPETDLFAGLVKFMMAEQCSAERPTP